MANLPPIERNDFKAGRVTPKVIGYSQTPVNSVKDSLNVNFDEIVGSGKVRAGTELVGDIVVETDTFVLPQGLASFSPGSGAGLGSELVTNGSFTGSATGWDLGTGWTYGSNHVTYAVGSPNVITVTSDEIYTPPTTLSSLQVETYGAGGGGGGGRGLSGFSGVLGGNGGSGFSSNFSYGANAVIGNGGGGGAGAASSGNASGGSGGTASGGDTNTTGSSGSNGGSLAGGNGAGAGAGTGGATDLTKGKGATGIGAGGGGGAGYAAATGRGGGGGGQGGYAKKTLTATQLGTSASLTIGGGGGGAGGANANLSGGGAGGNGGDSSASNGGSGGDISHIAGAGGGGGANNGGGGGGGATGSGTLGGIGYGAGGSGGGGYQSPTGPGSSGADGSAGSGGAAGTNSGNGGGGGPGGGTGGDGANGSSNQGAGAGGGGGGKIVLTETKPLLYQNIGMSPGLSYQVGVTVGGTTGTVIVQLGTTGDSFVIGAGTGANVVIGVPATGSTFTINPSSDFNGTIDDVTVKQIIDNLLLVVYNGTANATLYAFNGSTWNTSNLTTLANYTKNRFTTLGASEFLTNPTDGMYSSTDGVTWVQGASNNCIDTANAKPSLIFRYKQRLLAAGDPTYPDRVFFSSVIDPTASPFITWNTDPADGDWIDVNPDDGGNITGFSENSTFCLIFKNTGMYRMDTVSQTVDPDNIFDIGATSQEAIILCQGVTYYFSGNGVYQTNGGYPQQISRAGVQDIIESMSPSDWSKVSAGTDGLAVWFSMGDITLNANQDNERLIPNCVIKYSPRDQSWSVHAYRDYFGFWAQYIDGDGDLVRVASDAGSVQTIDLGTLDADDAAIPFFLETQDEEFGNRSHAKNITNQMVVFTDNGLSSTFAARIDGNPTPTPIIGSLAGRVNMPIDLNLQGNFFNFYWSGVSSGNPPILEGYRIEDIQDQGMGPAQGTPDAPQLIS